jgi:hypothetical protein
MNEIYVIIGFEVSGFVLTRVLIVYEIAPQSNLGQL